MTEGLKRRELYEKVWTTPLTAIAKEFGITVFQLRKTCDEHNIPRPHNGYWSQIAFGKQVDKIPLSDQDDEEIKLFRERFEGDEIPSQTEISIAVPVVLEKPHKLTTSTQRHLNRTKPCWNGKLLPDGQADCLQIEVTKPQLDRALRLFDSLIKQLELKGGSATPCKLDFFKKPVTIFNLNEIEIDVTLTEWVRRTTLPRPSNIKPDDYYRDEFEYHPTGQLTFEFGTREVGMKCRDGVKKNIETSFNSVVAKMLAAFDKEHAERLERECWDRDWAQAAEDRFLHQKRRDALLKDMADWKQAQEIRHYLNAYRAKLEPLDEEQIEWLKWAEKFADDLDPLK
ncbi:MAG: hypothetical protein JWP89_2700 [Schlesneria sp.]|nr:hypothetical protein [Schlesneria sp.]